MWFPLGEKWHAWFTRMIRRKENMYARVIFTLFFRFIHFSSKLFSYSNKWNECRHRKKTRNTIGKYEAKKKKKKRPTEGEFSSLPNLNKFIKKYGNNVIIYSVVARFFFFLFRFSLLTALLHVNYFRLWLGVWHKLDAISSRVLYLLVLMWK